MERVRKIPEKLRREIEQDPFMEKCVICGSHQVEWEHCFGGIGYKQINEKWAIIPLCYDHHRGNKHTAEIKEKGRWIALNRATEEQLEKYHGLKQKKKYLNSKYGKWG